MEGHQQLRKSRVVKVDSKKSWDFLVSQATNQGCPVVVHFTAFWCMPSVAMNPIFEELALIYQHILFLLVDVDEVKVWHLMWSSHFLLQNCFSRCLQVVASTMKIKAMPTFLLMKEGATVDKLVGANSEEIRKRVKDFVNSIGSSKTC